MVAGENAPLIFSILTVLIVSSPSFLRAQLPYYDSYANLSTLWINDPYPIATGVAVYTSWSPILPRETNVTARNFACGFYCRSLDLNCVFGVLIFPGDNVNPYDSHRPPELVWSANRDNTVGVNATLRLKQDGDLVLANPDGILVWSTNTRGKSVAGLNLTEQGNLLLLGSNNEIIWQSFDHPTDSLLLGQRLVTGQKLKANVSRSRFDSGLLSLSVDNNRLIAYVVSNPPQRYHESALHDLPYVEFANGSFNGWAIPPVRNKTRGLWATFSMWKLWCLLQWKLQLSSI